MTPNTDWKEELLVFIANTKWKIPELENFISKQIEMARVKTITECKEVVEGEKPPIHQGQVMEDGKLIAAPVIAQWDFLSYLDRIQNKLSNLLTTKE